MAADFFYHQCRPKLCSLRNKRPGLSGRPSCKGLAIGVARTGARLGGERTLRVPPSCCSLPVSHAGGPPNVVSSAVVGRSCARARAFVLLAWRGVPRTGRERRPAKEGQKPKQEKFRARAARRRNLIARAAQRRVFLRLRACSDSGPAQRRRALLWGSSHRVCGSLVPHKGQLAAPQALH